MTHNRTLYSTKGCGTPIILAAPLVVTLFFTTPLPHDCGPVPLGA
jgi:hypothetical protein